MPRLRPLDFQPVTHRGERMWLLRDPLQLTETQLIFPTTLAQILLFLNGKRTLVEVYQAVKTHLGFEIPYDTVAHAVSQLDEALLLENSRSQCAKMALREQFRAQPFRPAALAGLSYAAEPAQLRAELQAYSNGDDLTSWQPWTGRSIISPHIDYMRGGQVYAQVWQRAAAAVHDADLVLMFGTDHNGGPGSLTLTRVPYATPFGVIPTDEAVVESLAAAIGEEDAFELELNHRQEHSVELSAVWMHHIAGGSPPPMVPVLVGSFQHFVMGQGHPEEDKRLTGFIDALRRATAGKRVLAVASVDMAHVGPQFGDEYVMDNRRRMSLRERDFSLIEAISRGDATRFYDEIAAIQDGNRICGFSSTYLMLRYLGLVDGQLIAYDQCEADPNDESLVSICGMLLT